MWFNSTDVAPKPKHQNTFVLTYNMHNWIHTIVEYFNYCLCHFIVLTSTPDPTIPPKYQTCTVILSLSTEVPPGKKSKMLHSTHTIDRGSRLIPRHLAKPPEHILIRVLQSLNSTWKSLLVYLLIALRVGSSQIYWIFWMTLSAAPVQSLWVADAPGLPLYPPPHPTCLLSFCNSQLQNGLITDHIKDKGLLTSLYLLTN